MNESYIDFFKESRKRDDNYLQNYEIALKQS